MQVAEQHQAHAAERLARPAAVDAQRLVDGPHQVRAHHRYLVDDQQLQLAHDAAVAAAADVVGPDQARRKAEERVNGLAADVDGGKARSAPGQPSRRAQKVASARSSVDLPVPARPVMNRCPLSSRRKCSAASYSAVGWTPAGHGRGRRPTLPAAGAGARYLVALRALPSHVHAGAVICVGGCMSKTGRACADTFPDAWLACCPRRTV